jgi:lipid A ethanolaminephosphotransferase
MKKLATLTITQTILAAGVALTALYNVAFFKNSFATYPLNLENLPFIISLTVLLFSITIIFLSLVCYRPIIKAVLIFIFVSAASASYFMDSYNIVIDTAMIQSALETSSAETRDLITMHFLLYIVFLGLLPALIISRIDITTLPLKTAIFSRAKLIGTSTAVLLITITSFSSHYTTFFREHKNLRYYANPLTFLYSSGVLVNDSLGKDSAAPVQQVGLDARIPTSDIHRELVILVVGETARADHFSLNGYERNTSPRLAEKSIASFQNMRSCGTATAISVPCMFSLTDEGDFDLSDASNSENVLDVLLHSDASLLWRDNNTGAKGLIADEHIEDFSDPAINTICDVECRDEGMLVGLENFISTAEGQDIVIVLHQMGNHGPAYYKRYPTEFEVFSPACQTAQLEQCSNDEIINAYDNAILYTDHFLAEVIDFLEPYDNEFETGMLYVSDHGESLGENGLYLHGLPNFMAPDTQREVPAILWLGKNYHIGIEDISASIHSDLTHDNFSHTVLGLLEIETDIYRPELDIIHGCCS